MAKINVFLCLISLIVCYFVGVNTENSCHQVRTEFQNRRIGLPELVPENPVHGKNIV